MVDGLKIYYDCRHGGDPSLADMVLNDIINFHFSQFTYTTSCGALLFISQEVLYMKFYKGQSPRW